MGLAEKRIVATLKNENFPKWEKDVLSACPGLDVEFDISWGDLVKEGFAQTYPMTVEWNFFAPLSAAIRQIAIDALGATAMKEKIKKIKITSQRPWSSLKVSVDGDMLHLDADPTFSTTEKGCSSYASQITGALEAAL